MGQLRIVPKTAADSFYAPAGQSATSMASLQNLVPAIDTDAQWVPRPAATILANSNTKTPGFVSCQLVVGTRIYGLISSALNAGKDEPFCYDLLGAAFVSISGITSSNVPTSPATTGAWTPPHCDLVGAYVVITSVGYSGTGSNYFGMINIGTPSSLSYNSYQITTQNGVVLPSVPIWISQFNGRAYFLCNPTNAPPAAIFSEISSPATFYASASAPYTNALTFGGNLLLTCAGTVSFDNQLGGQAQSLIVFQGDSNMWQIEGDPAVTTSATANINQGALQINSLNVATGTIAPNTVCNTPMGLAFVAPDGLRIIDFNAHVSPPIGYGGTGIALPFVASATPSRMAAACNATTIRVSTINSAVVNSPQQEWCYDLTRKAWFGPHTFPVSLITFYGTSFIVSPIGLTGFWQSDIVPNASSTYTENGAAMTCVWQSAYFPTRPQMEQLSTDRSVAYLGYGGGTSNFSVSALDISGAIILGGFATMSFTASQTLWNQFAWGHSIWLGTVSNIAAEQVPWTQPLIFDRMAIQINVTAAAGIRIGDFLLDFDQEAYTVQSL